MSTINIKMNTAKWSSCTNRHPTTRGFAWGWIEGSDITWSNDPDSTFTGKDAAVAVAEHNQWLEDSRPVELRLIDARNKAFALQKDVNEKRAACRIAEEKLAEVHALIRKLDPTPPPNPRRDTT